jgi:O-antigen ligase
VGLFANRNHHAMFLAATLPMLACLASRPAGNSTARQLQLGIAAFATLFVLAALVIIGSRAGFFLGVAGAASALALYREPQVLGRTYRDRPKRATAILVRWKWIAWGLVGALAVPVLLLGNSETMQRIMGTDLGDELRLQIWAATPVIGWEYFPFGSGIGSFVEVYKVNESSADLGFRYVNHAHNDWLEIFLTVGLPGLLLLSGATAAWVAATKAVFSRHAGDGEAVLLARLGSIVTGLLALGSLVDYPLRTPSLACLFVIAAVWLSRGYGVSRASLGK